MYEIIKTLFAIAKINGVNLALYDNEIFIIKELSSDLARLSPISDTDKENVIYNPEDLLTYNKLNKTALQRLLNGFETDLQRTGNGFETNPERYGNGTETDLQRTGNGTETNPEQVEVIGEGKVNLKKFSDTCPESCRETSEKIEALFDKILNKTNKKATIEKLIKMHKQAAGFANADNIFQLKQIETRLKGISNKQQAIRASEQTIQRRQRRKKILIKISTFAAVGALVFFLISRKINRLDDATPPRSYSICAAGLSDETDLFTKCCNEYEQKTGKKIYPKGRECLRRACSGIENPEKILEIINNNMK